jgi:hypothetical protein
VQHHTGNHGPVQPLVHRLDAARPDFEEHENACHGKSDDPTRKPEYYDSTFNYLRSLGIHELT